MRLPIFHRLNRKHRRAVFVRYPRLVPAWFRDRRARLCLLVLSVAFHLRSEPSMLHCPALAHPSLIVDSYCTPFLLFSYVQQSPARFRPLSAINSMLAGTSKSHNSSTSRNCVTLSVFWLSFELFYSDSNNQQM